MPCFRLEDNTKTFIRNLMTLELCHYPSDSYIIDYIIFMDDLINTSEDVDLLTKNGILVNWLGDSKAAANLFNSLSINIVFDDYNFFFSHICEKLYEYYKVPKHKWKATLRRDYFGTRWKTASTVAAILLLYIVVDKLLHVPYRLMDTETPLFLSPFSDHLCYLIVWCSWLHQSNPLPSFPCAKLPPGDKVISKSLVRYKQLHFGKFVIASLTEMPKPELIKEGTSGWKLVEARMHVYVQCYHHQYDYETVLFDIMKTRFDDKKSGSPLGMSSSIEILDVVRLVTRELSKVIRPLKRFQKRVREDRKAIRHSQQGKAKRRYESKQ
ncbi:hypothetical protein LguiB_027643 [Lonicera macranthoides]